jgi:hypothetical protein
MKPKPRSKLEALFEGEVRPRWKHDEEYFSPSPAGRRTCKLSAATTEFLIKNLRGRNSKKAAYVLIEPEGDARLGGMQVLVNWTLALKVALDEGVYIYNARSKKCCRPIWNHPLDERTLRNMTFEPVRLIADRKTYDDKIPKVNTRLFDIEGP